MTIAQSLFDEMMEEIRDLQAENGRLMEENEELRKALNRALSPHMPRSEKNA